MNFFILYALAIDHSIELLWNLSVRKYRIQQLQHLIDEALDNWDAEAFYQYSAELAGLKAVQAYGQVNQAGGAKG